MRGQMGVKEESGKIPVGTWSTNIFFTESQPIIS
jgi:hypothetical protein